MSSKPPAKKTDVPAKGKDDNSNKKDKKEKDVASAAPVEKKPLTPTELFDQLVQGKKTIHDCECFLLRC